MSQMLLMSLRILLCSKPHRDADVALHLIEAGGTEEGEEQEAQAPEQEAEEEQDSGRLRGAVTGHKRVGVPR